MHVEGVDGKGGLSLSESIEVDVGNDEARGVAVGVLEDSLKVALNWDVWPCQAMEHWDLLVLLVVIIWLSHPFKKREEEGDHLTQFSDEISLSLAAGWSIAAEIVNPHPNLESEKTQTYNYHKICDIYIQKVDQPKVSHMST